jgi:hypothetical protein
LSHFVPFLHFLLIFVTFLSFSSLLHTFCYYFLIFHRILFLLVLYVGFLVIYVTPINNLLVFKSFVIFFENLWSFCIRKSFSLTCHYLLFVGGVLVCNFVQWHIYIYIYVCIIENEDSNRKLQDLLTPKISSDQIWVVGYFG